MKKTKGDNSIRLTNSEYQCVIFVFMMIAFISSALYSLTNTTAWPDFNERQLCTSAMILLLLFVVTTGSNCMLWIFLFISISEMIVLPGRIIRMNANISLEVLALKRLFVRYVSHEIRSMI